MPAEATGNKYAVLYKNKFIGIVSKFELGWVFVEEFNHFTKLNLVLVQKIYKTWTY